MDINCDKCEFRVGEGGEGQAAMDRHNATKHPPVRRLADQKESPAVKPEVTGQAKPESTDSSGFGDAIRRKYGSTK